MYKDSDLDAAVAAGIMQSDVAEQFRRLSAERVGNPPADDEHFTVVSGLSEVYVTFGIALILSATYMTTSWMGPFAGLLFAVLSWLLAEYFTRRRRMVLPSIVLLAAFVLGNVFGWFAMSLILPGSGQGQTYLGSVPLANALTPLRGFFVTSLTFVACLCFWWRFGFPLAYAATVLATYNLPIYLLRIGVPDRSAVLEDAALMVCGLVTFAVAMWWDMSDVYRQTRRSDIAFWLHALAATVLAMMGLQLVVGISPSAGVPFDRFSQVFLHLTPVMAVKILVLYASFCVVAILVDRRAFMLTGLPIITVALSALFGSGRGVPVLGTVTLGILILTTAIWWGQLRAALLSCVPDVVRAQLPRSDLGLARRRPVY